METKVKWQYHRHYHDDVPLRHDFVRNEFGCSYRSYLENVFADSGSANMIGMLGNAMNFLAYLFMGIPAGKLLTKIGYKKTALTGIATGFVGVLIQFLSGKFGADISGFAVYLFGAFISGFAVCI